MSATTAWFGPRQYAMGLSPTLRATVDCQDVLFVQQAAVADDSDSGSETDEQFPNPISEAFERQARGAEPPTPAWANAVRLSPLTFALPLRRIGL